MILTEEQAMDRLNSEDNLATRFGAGNNLHLIVEAKQRGNPPGRPHLRDDVKDAILFESRMKLGTQSQIAAKYGTTQANVSYIHRGDNKFVDEEKIETLMDTVRTRAIEKVMAAMNFMTDDKLSGCKAIELSNIAKNMATVAGVGKQEQNSSVQVHLYSPGNKTEEDYTTIEVTPTRR